MRENKTLVEVEVRLLLFFLKPLLEFGFEGVLVEIFSYLLCLFFNPLKQVSWEIDNGDYPDQ